MTSRSFKPSSLSLRPRRPQLGSRASSASSMSSQKSQDISSAPATPSKTSAAGYFTAADIARSVSVTPVTVSVPQSSLIQPIDSPRIGRSKPIAIDLPPRRGSGPVETPPEPLSARGDLLGGYFPFHEEVQRSYQTHPFHNYHENNLKTRTMADSESPMFTPHGHILANPMQTTMAETFSPSMMAMPPPPPIFPSNMAMPMGKYHPSNFKNKTPNPTPTIQTPVGGPELTENSNHNRQKSDVRRKLQQYQRDMVEQAALAGRMNLPGGRPVSPRLAPLGSPGPVTPMELEESGGYMIAGARCGDPNQQEMIGRMIRAEELRTIRDDSCSPIVPAGGRN